MNLGIKDFKRFLKATGVKGPMYTAAVRRYKVRVNQQLQEMVKSAMEASSEQK